jgi:hypothetical protein
MSGTNRFCRITFQAFGKSSQVSTHGPFVFPHMTNDWSEPILPDTRASQLLDGEA